MTDRTDAYDRALLDQALTASPAWQRGRAAALEACHQGRRDITQERDYIESQGGFVAAKLAACDAALEQLDRALEASQ